MSPHFKKKEVCPLYANSFAENDYIAAKEAFSLWQGTVKESVEDYLLRKRKAELNELVRKVIRRELSSSDKLLVELRWYEGYSNKEIAEKLELDPSTVSRRLNKINDILYDKLKYAVEYRFGSSFSSKDKLIIKNVSASRSSCDLEKISGRIAYLRKRQELTVKDVSLMTGISESRLSELEKDAESITVKQLQKIALCFCVTTDYLIFGKAT